MPERIVTIELGAVAESDAPIVVPIVELIDRLTVILASVPVEHRAEAFVAMQHVDWEGEDRDVAAYAYYERPETEDDVSARARFAREALERKAREREDDERAELARLKAKYET